MIIVERESQTTSGNNSLDGLDFTAKQVFNNSNAFIGQNSVGYLLPEEDYVVLYSANEPDFVVYNGNNLTKYGIIVKNNLNWGKNINSVHQAVFSQLICNELNINNICNYVSWPNLKANTFNWPLISPIENHSSIEDLNFLISLKEKEIISQLKAIDYLYDYIDNYIDINAFGEIDSIINLFVFKDFKLKLVIAFLTITHSIKEKLINREILLEHAKEVAKNEGLAASQVDSVLKGF